MEALVTLFFIASTAAAVLVGATFARLGPRPFRSFGLGLTSSGVAFAIWTIAVITKPEGSLGGWVTVGVFFFFAALVLFALSWVSELPDEQRTIALLVGAAWVVGVVVLRIVYPSHPDFSENGLFFFNPHGSVAAFEIFGLTAGMLPAVFRLAGRLKTRDALVAKVSFVTLVVGGVLLISSHDEVLLNFDGWAMGLAFLALLYSFVARKPETWLA